MHKFFSVAALAAVSMLLDACGGGAFQGSSSTSGTGNGGSTTPTPVYSMGSGTGSSFQSGAIGLSSASLSAGGSASLSVTIVDQTGTLYSGGNVTVVFNSPCIAQGLATVAASGSSTPGQTAGSVSTGTGNVTATYTAKGCSGPDVITATATVGSANLSATGTITVAAAAIGSIQFVSASPISIGLKGTGLNETSTVIFKVLDSTGGARPGVTVNFSLNTQVGGLSLSPSSGTTAADGTVQTVVSAGTVHTSVRVTASIASPALSTQSSQLTVTTGLPASAGFSISVGSPSYATTGLACPNVEAYGQDGVVVPVTVRLSDRYNNPAPDGTSIAFTTDGGHVGGACTTPSAPGAADGTCTVNWTSANPRPLTTGDSPPILANGRAMILATAIGEESFTDTNGNGFWDSGEPFVNLGEPYRDDNENAQYDSGEYFLDFNQNGTRDVGDGTFKGITCTGSGSSSTCGTSTLAIGAQHLLIMSTSGARIFATPTSLSVPHSVSGGAVSTASLTYTVVDDNYNPMPAGTTISVSVDSTVGSVAGPGVSWTIGCRSGAPTQGNQLAAGDTLGVSFTAGSTVGASGSIQITVTSPGTKTVTIGTIPVTIT